MLLPDNQIITILGPTATGKTHLAVSVAEQIDGEIISADSRQVYRRMDIGTGKDIEEYTIHGKEIPYHLIDIAEPGEEYNLFKYQQAAQSVIDNIQKKGKQVIICGGSGMYIEALLKGYKLFPVPEDKKFIAHLSGKSDEELIRMLASMRHLHNHTDTCERDRLIHAITIEKYYLEHPELQEISMEHASIIFGIRGDRELIRQRITQRLKERLENGMIEEVDNLIKSGVNSNQLIRYGLEYKFITQYLTQQIDKESMFNQLNIAIHQFSKRQMTWFRKMERDGFLIHWIDVSLAEDEKINFIIENCQNSIN